MARKQKRSPARLVGVIVIAAVAAVVWYGVNRLGWHLQSSSPAPATNNPSPPDTTGEARKVSVSGVLSVPAAARDAELGVSADAAVLLRNVEMYQWREKCAGDTCSYDQEWSAKPIDASKFRTPAGHDNPKFPFFSAKFSSGPIKLGGYTIDPELLTEQIALQKHDVRSADLPSNLAATFRVSDGTLTTADDSSHPKSGALRVSYRVVPAGETRLTGVQHGARLSAN
jgi:Transmembrane protein 43